MDTLQPEEPGATNSKFKKTAPVNLDYCTRKNSLLP